MKKNSQISKESKTYQNGFISNNTSITKDETKANSLSNTLDENAINDKLNNLSKTNKKQIVKRKKFDSYDFNKTNDIKEKEYKSSIKNFIIKDDPKYKKPSIVKIPTANLISSKAKNRRTFVATIKLEDMKLIKEEVKEVVDVDKEYKDQLKQLKDQKNKLKVNKDSYIKTFNEKYTKSKTSCNSLNVSPSKETFKQDIRFKKETIDKILQTKIEENNKLTNKHEVLKLALKDKSDSISSSAYTVKELYTQMRKEQLDLINLTSLHSKRQKSTDIRDKRIKRAIEVKKNKDNIELIKKSNNQIYKEIVKKEKVNQEKIIEDQKIIVHDIVKEGENYILHSYRNRFSSQAKTSRYDEFKSEIKVKKMELEIDRLKELDNKYQLCNTIKVEKQVMKNKRELFELEKKESIDKFYLSEIEKIIMSKKQILTESQNLNIDLITKSEKEPKEKSLCDLLNESHV